jgi:4-azaleucine resistance transporter AzlC
MSFFGRHRMLLGVKDGIYQSVGIALAGALFSFVFGVLAEHWGLSFLQGLSITALVYAGALQMISLHLWFAHPVPTITLLILSFVVCARYILMGMVMRDKLRGVRPLFAYIALFFVADETWALTILRSRKKPQPIYLYGYFLGAGLNFYILWVIASCFGMIMGDYIVHPEAMALDFAFIAIFLALLVGLWHGKADMLPWFVAAVVALISSYFIAGSWFIVLGALAGSIAGVVRDEMVA